MVFLVKLNLCDFYLFIYTLLFVFLNEPVKTNFINEIQLNLQEQTEKRDELSMSAKCVHMPMAPGCSFMKRI
jgi:hypothetical protein